MQGQLSPQVVAIVPAFNEAARIGPVIESLLQFSGFSEVIVVDDGSTDHTSQTVSRYPVRLIRLDPNQGKGAAMQAGVEASQADIIFFCDADIKGLTTQDIQIVLTPVLQDKQDMFIAMRSRLIFRLVPGLISFTPLLSGERAVARSLWERVPSSYKRRFRIEAALNFYATHSGRGRGYAVFPHLSQTIKEAKYGPLKGAYARLKMVYEVSASYTRLYWEHLTKSAG